MRIKTLKNNILSDVYRYDGNRIGSVVKCLIIYPGAQFMLALRLCKKYAKIPVVNMVFRMVWGMLRIRYGYDIPWKTSIGPGFYIGHYGGVVISSCAVIGDNVNISHGVTIGKISMGKRSGYPVIGDRVWIGTNAIIVGGICIGSDSVIAPGAFVNFDVPAESLVLGNPGQVKLGFSSISMINNKYDIK